MQIRHQDHEFSPVNGLFNQVKEPQTKHKKTNTKKIICIAGSLVGAFVLIIVIVILVLFATSKFFKIFK